MNEPAYLEVEAEPRYWEDATVDGVSDEDGSRIPLRNGGLWKPVIELSTGRILDWPAGTKAQIHYKVCDAGEYWLQDSARRRIAKYGSSYVPSRPLCPEKAGYGDYIIMEVGPDGQISGWRNELDLDRWHEDCEEQKA